VADFDVFVWNFWVLFTDSLRVDTTHSVCSCFFFIRKESIPACCIVLFICWLVFRHVSDWFNSPSSGNWYWFFVNTVLWVYNRIFVARLEAQFCCILFMDSLQTPGVEWRRVAACFYVRGNAAEFATLQSGNGALSLSTTHPCTLSLFHIFTLYWAHIDTLFLAHICTLFSPAFAPYPSPHLRSILAYICAVSYPSFAPYSGLPLHRILTLICTLFWPTFAPYPIPHLHSILAYLCAVS